MTQRDALHTAGGVTSASDARYAQNGLFLPDSSGSAITPKAGVIHGPNYPYLVEANSPIAMNVTVRAGNAVMVRNGQGYLAGNDGSYVVPIGTVPGSGSRYDIVYVKQTDATDQGDADTAPYITTVSGTSGSSPSLAAAIALVPAGGLILGYVQVYSTDSGGIGASRITDARTFTSLRGAILPVSSTDNTAGTYVGQYRDHSTYGLQRWNGTIWNAVAGTAMCRAQARQTVAQTGLANSTFLGITFNTTDYDNFGAFSGSTFTCPAGQAGLYMVNGSLTVGTTANSTYATARILKNGSPLSASPGTYGTVLALNNGGTATSPKLVNLNAGETLSLQGYVSFTNWATGVFVDSASTLTVVRLA